MSTYFVRRLIMMVPNLFIVTIIVFLLVRMVPGDVIDSMMADSAGQFVGATNIESREALEKALGLDVPVHVQYGRWVSGIFRGDLGDTLWGYEPVSAKIVGRLPVTFELGLMSIIIGLLIALPIGIYSAIRQDTISDYMARSVAIVFISVPSFWVGTMIMIYPAVWWGWAPPMELIPFTEDPLGNLGMFIIPSVLLGLGLSGTTMRMVRTMMLEVLRQDYIRTAWSKGLKEKVVIMRHALKNALIPVVTIIGFQIPILVGGSVIIEQIFVLPGIGRLMVSALSQRDYPIVSGVNLILASSVLIINLLVDLTYAYLDPRLQYR